MQEEPLLGCSFHRVSSPAAPLFLHRGAAFDAPQPVGPQQALEGGPQSLLGRNYPGGQMSTGGGIWRKNNFTLYGTRRNLLGNLAACLKPNSFQTAKSAAT